MKREYWVAMLPFYLLVTIIAVSIAKGGSQAVTTINQNLPIEREHRIVIDAGHGGVDGGATSCTGVLESAINLEIALRLNDLMHFLGYETVMIRTTDESVYTEGNTIAAKKVSDLKERVRIANSTEGAIVLSIHQNTFSSSRYSGAQVFWAENEQSRGLASSLQSALVAALDPSSRRVSKKASGVYLMEHIDCTGVLIECGFLSNPEDEAKLRSVRYQQQLCCVIAATVSSYIDS